jgi:hypothetical protein
MAKCSVEKQGRKCRSPLGRKQQRETRAEQSKRSNSQIAKRPNTHSRTECRLRTREGVLRQSGLSQSLAVHPTLWSDSREPILCRGDPPQVFSYVLFSDVADRHVDAV